MEKTYVKPAIESKYVPINSLEIRPEQIYPNLPDVDSTAFQVFGKAADGRKVWVATFFDSDEAMSWLQANRIFKRPVRGAVVPGQEPATAVGDPNDPTRVEGGEPAPRAN